MDKFLSDFAGIIANPKYLREFWEGIQETAYSTVAATLVAFALGLFLAVLLVVGEEGGVRPLPRWVMKPLNILINILRSAPFLILMLFILPLSKILVGTNIGTIASIPPLIIAAAPFVARLVEASLREMDRGVIEAAQAMGCSPWQIVYKVMLPESKPSLINGFTTAAITILSYSAMSGAIGGGGLGAMALLRGHGRQETVVLYVAVIFLVLLVQVIQSIGTAWSVKTDRRITKTKTKRRSKK